MQPLQDGLGGQIKSNHINTREGSHASVVVSWGVVGSSKLGKVIIIIKQTGKGQRECKADVVILRASCG
jgi:hypothetical protein